MKSINRVQLLGHLGSDPEMKTSDKTTIANFSLATSCLKETGEEIVNWHRVVAYGKLAERCSEKLKKGSPLLLDEGHLETHHWEKDGIKFERTVVVADKLIFLPQYSEKSRHADDQQSGATPSQQESRAQEEKSEEEPTASDRQIWKIRKLLETKGHSKAEIAELLEPVKTKKQATLTIDRLTKEENKETAAAQ